MDLIAPKFAPPVTATPLLSATPVMNTNGPGDDEEDNSLQLSKGQEFSLLVIAAGAAILSRGKVSPDKAMKIVRFGVKGFVGLGAAHLTTSVGGHSSDTAHRQPRPMPLRDGPLPPQPSQTPATPPSRTPSIQQSVVMGVLSTASRSQRNNRVPDGTALDFVDDYRRLVGPHLRTVEPVLVIGPSGLPMRYPFPRGVLGSPGLFPEMIDAARIGIGATVTEPVPVMRGVPATNFGGMGDVQQNNPKGIVSNLTRQGVNDNIGNGITLVAQCGDP